MSKLPEEIVINIINMSIEMVQSEIHKKQMKKICEEVEEVEIERTFEFFSSHKHSFLSYHNECYLTRPRDHNKAFFCFFELPQIDPALDIIRDTYNNNYSGYFRAPLNCGNFLIDLRIVFP
jgi:hypothetical protein